MAEHLESKEYSDIDVHEKAKKAAQILERKMLESILKSAMDRKPERLSCSSSSKELIDLALPVQPESEISCALSEWPTSGEYRNDVKHWIYRNHKITTTDADDFIDGACEPLAYFLSKFMAKDMRSNKYNGGNNNDVQGFSFRTQPCKNQYYKSNRV